MFPGDLKFVARLSLGECQGLAWLELLQSLACLTLMHAEDAGAAWRTGVWGSVF